MSAYYIQVVFCLRFQVYIVDKTKPSLECPKPLPVTASPLQLYQTVRWQEPTAVDLIDGNIKFVYFSNAPYTIYVVSKYCLPNRLIT